MIEALSGHLVLVGPPLAITAGLALILAPMLRLSRIARTVLVGLASLAMVVPLVGLWVILPLFTGANLLAPAHLWILLGWLVLPVLLTELLAAHPQGQSSRAARALGMNWWRALLVTRLPAIAPGLLRGLGRAWLIIIPAACLAGFFTVDGLGGLGALLRAADLPTVAGGVLLTSCLAWAGALVCWLLQRAVGRLAPR